ncbi:hypothetical protein Nepgr_012516 [Nepenthes gracilis]|uniref:Uncharacterized protein n=1 Tax=Nepenthes gracilis TaxID=150966 RepID=A0AAD3SH27_NEPGR|nr:hypothetical protein Nepgr_012516 [Nepenthes gracilis]
MFAGFVSNGRGDISGDEVTPKQSTKQLLMLINPRSIVSVPRSTNNAQDALNPATGSSFYRLTAQTIKSDILRVC